MVKSLAMHLSPANFHCNFLKLLIVSRYHMCWKAKVICCFDARSVIWSLIVRMIAQKNSKTSSTNIFSPTYYIYIYIIYLEEGFILLGLGLRLHIPENTGWLIYTHVSDHTQIHIHEQSNRICNQTANCTIALSTQTHQRSSSYNN